MTKMEKRSKTFTFPRRYHMNAKDAKDAYMKVDKKRVAFMKKVRKAGAKDIWSETYTISRDSPKGPLHRAVIYYHMPKGKYIKQESATFTPVHSALLLGMTTSHTVDKKTKICYIRQTTRCTEHNKPKTNNQGKRNDLKPS